MLGSMMVVFGVLGVLESDMHRPPALLYMHAAQALQAGLATLILLTQVTTLGDSTERRMVDRQKITEIMPMMDAISPTFCMAKWHHTQLYLHTGETHSCYHPPPHKIDPRSIISNPAALHNTRKKISERQEMLDGKRPSGCQYCWNIEDLGPE